MKKTFAVLMLATMLFAVGCGNQAQEAAKDAQQKVEQTANEAKDAANKAAEDASAKVDEAKDAANKVAEDASAKVDEAKDAANKAADDAAAKVDEAKDAASKVADDAAAKVGELKDAVTGRLASLNGVMPGASIEDLQAQFGEATSTEGDVITFANGLKAKFDNATKKVKEISTTDSAFTTPEGMYVGADEYLLNEYCGPADAVRKVASGAEYEYFSGDKKSGITYTAENGVITKITCAVK